MSLHIHIASDHAGLGLKLSIKKYLESIGHNIQDHGTHSLESCDYPVYAHALCRAVQDTQNKGNIGILICGTGIGMSMVANRYPAIRAALCTHEFHARATREHNDANVLCLGERVTGLSVALAIVDTFLTTPFVGGRHQQRIDLFTDACC